MNLGVMLIVSKHGNYSLNNFVKTLEIDFELNIKSIQILYDSKFNYTKTIFSIDTNFNQNELEKLIIKFSIMFSSFNMELVYFNDFILLLNKLWLHNGKYNEFRFDNINFNRNRYIELKQLYVNKYSYNSK